MLNLQSRLKGNNKDKKYTETRVAIREKLLTEEVAELASNLRNQKVCKVTFPNQGILHEMNLSITPSERLYKVGVFKFTISVPPEYNHVPPTAKCLTRVWHPNITEEGAICLSILRENSLDSFGWSPTRKISDVVHGLASLFTDLIDFDDPLNQTAADEYLRNRESFERKVQDYTRKYARN